jgi:hypothetical protein
MLAIKPILINQFVTCDIIRPEILGFPFKNNVEVLNGHSIAVKTPKLSPDHHTTSKL